MAGYGEGDRDSEGDSLPGDLDDRVEELECLDVLNISFKLLIHKILLFISHLFLEYSGENFILKFYPDAAMTSSLQVSSLW